MSSKRLTAKQYLKIHRNKYVLVTYEFGSPIFIAPLKDLQIQVTDKREHAELWSELDISPMKLEYHNVATGYKKLEFEKIDSLLIIT